MNRTFRDIVYPSTYKYSSDSEFIPLEFYEEVFPISEKIDLLLGYFSSNAIKVLSKSFAEFIYNGGKMRLITNHIYSLSDYENLLKDTNLKDEDKIIDIFSDLSDIERNLSFEGKHFFDCLKYLLNNGRLELTPVKFNKIDLAHCKKMILYDGNHYILTEGSINFTLPALIKNSESFQVETPWNGKICIKRIEEERNNFEKIINRTHPNYIYIDTKNVEVVINSVGRSKDISDLLDDSLKLDENKYSEKVKRIIDRKKERFNKRLEIASNNPKFPFPQGPRNYQVQAYKSWVKNDFKGIFAMATGTGKTLTALNCLLELYKVNGIYQAIVLVPTLVLMSQWKDEIVSFGFDNIITSQTNNWKETLGIYFLLTNSPNPKSFIFVCTYATFNGKKFQGMARQKDLANVLLIADEAHNLGTRTSLENLPISITNRIGLSATPNRKYDEYGSKELELFFNSYAPNYTFSFSMKEAIDEGYLSRYYYFPYLTSLTYEELKNYKEISKQLLKHFDFKIGKYRESAEMLLIKRKRIIHQAQNKKIVFKKLLARIKSIEGGTLSHTLVYVPEGYDHDYSCKQEYEIDDADNRIITEYSKIISQAGYTTHQILSKTKEREKILKRFDKGRIQVLTSMKTLDEGVDIPSSKHAIFCSSTGNPRQFIQRRGRILRKAKGKSYAYVYDIIVAPNPNMWEGESIKERELLGKMEKNIFKSEIYRIANFLYVCENRADLSIGKDSELKEIVALSEKLEIDLNGLINELIDMDNETKTN